MSQQKIVIVIATYNERDNLPRLVAQLFDVLPDAHIVVVDDDSPDGTGEWCQEYSDSHSQLSCLIRRNQRGLGTATIFGLKSGIQLGADLVVTMDADLSHDPSCLPKMIELIQAENHELVGAVIGSRYISGGKIVGWPWSRKIASRCANTFARLWLGLKPNDNTSAFRVYRSSALKKMDLDSVKSSGYGYLEEIVLKLQKMNIRIVESPITFTDRQAGKSKASLRVGLRALWRILVMRFQ